jgi:hypothetical protein
LYDLLLGGGATRLFEIFKQGFDRPMIARKKFSRIELLDVRHDYYLIGDWRE